MAVKIRLQRKGRKKAPFYQIVIADARSPRDGRFIEKIGTYNPLTVPATIDIDRQKALTWLQNGAQPTETVRAILRFKGVTYNKWLLDGVRKGKLTEDQAEAKFQEFIAAKEEGIAKRKLSVAEQKAAAKKAADGVAKPKAVKVVEAPPAPEVVEVEAPEVVEAVATETVVETVAAVETETVTEVVEVVEMVAGEDAELAAAGISEENMTVVEEATGVEETPAADETTEA